MSKQSSLVSVRREFVTALEGSANLAAAVYEYCKRDYDSVSTNPLHSRQARRVVALAFLWAVAAWESFIGDAFLRYLAGAKSPAGWAPDLALGPARSLRHACAVVSGRPAFNRETGHLNWATDDILSRCKLFLQPGNRIEVTLKEHKGVLDAASVIRNRVAHASPKCRSAFKDVAQRIRGQSLYQSYSVGDLLLEPRPASFPNAAVGSNVLEAFINLYLHLCDQVVP